MTANLHEISAMRQKVDARREYQAAVLTGIYASLGRTILDIEDDKDYAGALKNAARVARDQADEMLKLEQAKK